MKQRTPNLGWMWAVAPSLCAGQGVNDIREYAKKKLLQIKLINRFRPKLK